MAEISPSSRAFENAILRRLSKAQQESLRPHLRPIEFKIHQVLYEPEQRIEDVYFVEQGLISVVSFMADASTIEVSVIGHEGVAGGIAILEVDRCAHQYFVPIAGHGYRIAVATLKSECKRNARLHELILKYQGGFLTIAMQVSACNGLHSVLQRCCRWILMSQDRLQSAVLPLTHEFLGMMLGVRRASVSEVLQPLQEHGWLKSSRGEITILDRKAIESQACECYEIISNQYQRMLD
jgi:CRP-like cAMP-binding protein